MTAVNNKETHNNRWCHTCAASDKLKELGLIKGTNARTIDRNLIDYLSSTSYESTLEFIAHTFCLNEAFTYLWFSCYSNYYLHEFCIQLLTTGLQNTIIDSDIDNYNGYNNSEFKVYITVDEKDYDSVRFIIEGSSLKMTKIEEKTKTKTRELRLVAR
jgi:hypothetical protein